MVNRQLPTKLSPTSIDLWRQCPRRFAYRHIDKLEVVENKSCALILGDVVHKALELLLRVAPERRTPAEIQRVIEWSCMRAARLNGIADAERERLGDETGKLVAGYLAVDGAQAQPIAVERTFALRLSNDTEIVTRADRVDRRDGGVLEVIDYKTGRWQLDSYDLVHETAPIVQLLAISKASQVPVERVTWHYLRSGESITWWPEGEDVDAATERLLDTVTKMHRDQEFEPIVGPHCVRCPYRAVCPEGGVVVVPAGEAA